MVDANIVKTFQAVEKKSRLSRYVFQGEGQDLRSRLQRLEQTSDEFELPKKIERIVAERGLVEFRSAITAILDRVEGKSFEIAVSGFRAAIRIFGGCSVLHCRRPGKRAHDNGENCALQRFLRGKNKWFPLSSQIFSTANSGSL